MLQEYGPKYPGYFSYHVVLGHCLTFLYRKYDAIQVLEDFLEKRGFQRKLIEMLARLYNEVGERKKSIEMWFRIFQVDPFDLECVRKLEDTIVNHLQETNPDFVNEVKPLLIDAWILYSAVESYLKEGNVIEATRLASRRLADTALQSKAYSETTTPQGMLQSEEPEPKTSKPSQQKFSSSIRTSVKILEEKHSDADPFGLTAVTEEAKQKRSETRAKDTKSNEPVVKTPKEQTSGTASKQEPFKPSIPVSIRPEKDLPLTPIVLDIHSFQTFTKGSELEIKSTDVEPPAPEPTVPETLVDVPSPVPSEVNEEPLAEEIVEGTNVLETNEDVIAPTIKPMVDPTQEETLTEINKDVLKEFFEELTPQVVSEEIPRRETESPTEYDVDEFGIEQSFKPIERTGDSMIHIEPTSIESAPIANILFPKSKSTKDGAKANDFSDTETSSERSMDEMEVRPEEIETEISPFETQEPEESVQEKPLLLDIQSEGVQVPVTEIEFVIPVAQDPIVEKEKPVAKRKVRPMVTRTVAELYAKQGEFQRAIDIYQELLNAQPNRTDLQSRIEELKKLIIQESESKSDEETN